MARAGLVGGATGWHRYVIFDTAVKHFSDWIIFGINDPLAWEVWQMRDITNQYPYRGFNGGGLALLCFLGLIIAGFRSIDRNLRAMADADENRLFVWCIGVILGAHCMTFLGLTYFGQISALWHLSLAMAASVSVLSGSGHSVVGEDDETPPAPADPSEAFAARSVSPSISFQA